MAQLVEESTCNVGGLGSIPGLGRFPGEGKGSSILAWRIPGTIHGVTKNNWATFTFTLLFNKPLPNHSTLLLWNYSPTGATSQYFLTSLLGFVFLHSTYPPQCMFNVLAFFFPSHQLEYKQQNDNIFVCCVHYFSPSTRYALSKCLITEWMNTGNDQKWKSCFIYGKD